MSSCGCRKSGCAGQLRTTDDGYLTCSKCSVKYEVKCKNGDVLRLNRRGLMPKHCPDCDEGIENDDDVRFRQIQTESDVAAQASSAAQMSGKTKVVSADDASPCSTATQAGAGMTSSVTPTDGSSHCGDSTQNLCGPSLATLKDGPSTESTGNATRDATKVRATTAARAEVNESVAAVKSDSITTLGTANITCSGAELAKLSNTVAETRLAPTASQHDSTRESKVAQSSVVHTSPSVTSSVKGTQSGKVNRDSALRTQASAAKVSPHGSDGMVRGERKVFQSKEIDKQHERGHSTGQRTVSSNDYEVRYQQTPPGSVRCSNEGSSVDSHLQSSFSNQTQDISAMEQAEHTARQATYVLPNEPAATPEHSWRKQSSGGGQENMSAKWSANPEQKRTLPAMHGTEAGELSTRHWPMTKDITSSWSSEQSVDVTFYVVVSESFEFDPTCDKLFIAFFTPPYECMQEMELTSGSTEIWSAKVLLPHNLLRNGLEYKYCISKGRDMLYEWIYRLPSDKITNRSLRLHHHTGGSHISHHRQYDIIAISEKYRENAGSSLSLRALVDYLKPFVGLEDTLCGMLAAESHRGFLCMMPNILEHLSSGKGSGGEVIDRFNAVVSCTQEGRVAFLDSSRHNLDSNLLNKAIEGYLQNQHEIVRRRVAAVQIGKQEKMECILCAIVLLNICYEKCKRGRSTDAFAYKYTAMVFSQLRWNDINMDDLRTELRKHMRDFRLVSEALIFCLQSSTQGDIKDDSGLLAVPIYHLLTGESFDHWFHNSRTDQFWGLSEPKFRYFIDTIKKRKPIARFEELRGIFAQCRISARTLIAALDQKSLMEALEKQLLLPMDGYVGAVFHYFLFRSQSLKGNYKQFEQALLNLVKVGESTSNTSRSDVVGREAFVALKIMEVVLSDLNKFDASMWGCVLQIFRLLDCLEFAVITSKINVPKNAHDNYMNMTTLVDKFGVWLVHFSERNISRDENKMWEAAFATEFQVPKTRELWTRKLETAFSNRLKKMSPTNVLDFYCETDFKIHQLEEISGAVAVHLVTQNPSLSTNMSMNVDEKRLKKVAKVFSIQFKEAVKALAGERDWLQFVLQWPLFLNFIDLASGKQSRFLDEVCQIHAHSCIKIFIDVCNGVKDATISYSDLSLLNANSDRYFKVCDLLANRKHLPDQSAGDIRRWLAVRRSEQEECDSLRTNLRHLYNLCESLRNVDMRSLEAALEDVKPKAIRALWTPLLCLEQDHRLPVENFFIPMSKTPVTAALLQQAKKVHKSLLFSHTWKQAHAAYHRVNELSDLNELFDLQDVIENVWPTAYSNYSQLVTRFNSTCETFSDAELLQQICSSDDGVRKEISIWADSDELSKRIYQRYERYRDTYSGVAVAHILKRIADQMQLTGDLSTLKFVTNLSNNMHRKVSDISDDDFKAIHQLKEFAGTERQQCLRAFVDCKPLIECVKTQVLDSKQLKVFVDLAMINAGEGDRNVHMVTCLHASVTGYSSLIYEVRPDAGLTKLLEACRSVMQSLEANPLLTQQLIDTCRNLDWVKSIKDAYGSVEVNSLSQATEFNDRGIYEVGPPAGPRTQKLTLDNTIRVTVLNKPKTGEALSETEEQNGGLNAVTPSYSYGHLIELQSKLMLVAGKAEQNNSDIETFLNMLRNVTRLAAALIAMHEAGSVLFDEWKALFFCDVRDGVNVHVEFGLSQQLLRGTTEMSCVQHASKLADFMEECIRDWNVHMVEQRGALPELNSFSTKQIVYLRQQLMRFRPPGDIDSKVYDMLAMLRPSCTRRDIEEAITKADAKMRASAASADRNINSNSARKTNLTAEDQHLVDELVKQGVNPNIAVKAVLACPGDSDIELLHWCNEHGDTDMETETLGNAEKDKGVDGSSIPKLTKRLDATIKELLDEIGSITSSTTLADQMRKLWNSFLEQASTSMVDFLSVQHLGTILRFLKSDSVTMRLSRPRALPPGLDRGRPCLLVCPQEKVLPAVVAIYAADSEWPLPTRNEVLVCSTTTLLEDVELFLDRALVDNLSAYVLANADRLNYDTCSYLEKKIENSLQEKADCFIAVVCAEEHENHSIVITALDRFRVRNFNVPSQDHLRQYLRKNLTPARKMEFPHGATPDIDGCCARIVCSEQAGCGKTLFVKRTQEKVMQQYSRVHFHAPVTIPLIQHEVNVKDVLDRLLHGCNDPTLRKRAIVHIDISQEVHHGVDEFLFNLLVLGSVAQEDGFVWQRSLDDYYMVEAMLINADEKANKKSSLLHSILALLPTIRCLGPFQCHEYYRDISLGAKSKVADIILMDEKEFRSSAWQRTFQYLKRLDRHLPFSDVDPMRIDGTPSEMLDTVMKHCGLSNPSWSELRYFVNFFNSQLHDCETSAFCSAAASEFLPGFFEFVTKLMLTMSRDFATRSLAISEESPHEQLTELQHGRAEQLLQGMEMKRKWEKCPHPYLFFNPDHNTVTFLGFCVDRRTGSILDPDTSKVLEANAVPQQLLVALLHNGVDLNENFNKKSRAEQIAKLCAVMGNEFPHDPDSSYELTMDNVKKILAIHMRFRCGIPVVIMGETGCGKTRLVRFMCDLQVPQGKNIRNMVLAKIHGGVSIRHLKKTVSDAYELAKENRRHYPHIDTILFLDEANTTDAIGLIKEIMCDGTLDGRPVDAAAGLRIIAAVNPYKKHSIDVIQKLEKAGLGYHVHANHTVDRFGTIPMRQLVYRVRALPLSMLPLVWDFGQLNPAVEEIYIRQMVQRQVFSGKLPSLPSFSDSVASLLVKCQSFMRNQKDECSFVSLRDIDRVLLIMSWFYSKRNLLHAKCDYNNSPRLDEVTWSVVLALGACYHACLEPEKRSDFRNHVSQYFIEPLKLPHGERQILNEIETCQTLIINSLKSHIAKDVAHNQALKENLFMMVVCIELRIPLFLIGKPGSSKSLAKAILTEAMQGEAADDPLFKEFKQTHMVSFQCSPLATPEGIVSTFRQCASLQKSRNLEKFVSVVVLDEIGLAEDSKLMPLKALHPLLEDGTDGDETPESHMKCAFIGISNWALDPAKMNRGILVQRGVPDHKELEDSARGICQFDNHALLSMMPVIKCLTFAYLEIFEESRETREFFGLRDFYSLMKMTAYFASKNKDVPHPYELQHAVRRNFGGYDDLRVVQLFEKQLGPYMDVRTIERCEIHPPCDTIGLIESSLSGMYTQAGGESRYLLFLTENYTALNLIQDKVQQLNPEIIFGSKFAKDLEYTQVCRNINRIKVCMEMGRPVMLLNLENLYESLYDALNQYYVYFGGKRFVDLGLGTHRVKCQVHEKFRLIVVALKSVVHEKFPIPLINRLEKHYITMTTVLRDEELAIVRRLDSWVLDFTSASLNRRDASRNQNFAGEDLVGYTSDTVATIVLQVTKDLDVSNKMQEMAAQIMEAAKYKLLLLATPDAILRTADSRLHAEMDDITDIYYNKQQHESLGEFLLDVTTTGTQCDMFVQVTTRSKLLAKDDVRSIERQLQVMSVVEMKIIESLQAVETEQQFTSEIKSFYATNNEDDRDSRCSSRTSLLLVQCEEGHENLDLIACARHIITSEHSRFIDEQKSSTAAEMDDSVAIIDSSNSTKSTELKRYIVVLLIQLNKSSSFPGFHGGKWLCLHIDDLKQQKQILPAISDARRATVSQLLEAGLNQQDDFGQLEQAKVKAADTHRFDVFGLLRTCLHEAASRLRDSTATNINSEASDRSTDRLKLLCKLFSENGSKVLQRAFLLCIVNLLREKERHRMTEDMALSWLKNEAAKFDNVTKSGTFRRSFEDCLKMKISPVFAAVLAFCDTNSNFDILDLRITGDCSWATELWIGAFTNMTLDSSSLVVTLAKAESTYSHSEVAVRCSRFNGNAFKPEFPFSWILKDRIDDAMKQSYNVQDIHAMLSAIIANDLDFGQHLTNLREDIYDRAASSYAHDYIYMSHRCTHLGEYEYLLRTLQATMATRNMRSIAGVHICFADLQDVFSRFNRIYEIAMITQVADFDTRLNEKLKDDDFLMATDLYALNALLLCLEGSSKGGVSGAGWANNVQLCRTISEETLAAYLDNPKSTISDVAQSCRYMWNKLSLVRLFVEDIIVPPSSLPDRKQIFEISYATTMFQYLSKDAQFDLKRMSSVQVLEDFLSFCNKKLVAAIYGEDVIKKDCFSCMIKMKEPVLLPCRHVICSRCLARAFQLSSSVSCPECKENIPVGYTYSCATEPERTRYDAHKRFKKMFNAFFVRVLTDIVFSGPSKPEPQLMQHMVSYVTLEAIEGDVESKLQRRTTKQLSPYTDVSLIDPTPVIRSFMLQLLLQSSKGQVDEYVNDYFERSMAVVQGDSTTHLEFCVLFVSCFEVYITHQMRPVNPADLSSCTKSKQFVITNVRKGSPAWLLFDNLPTSLCASSLCTIAKIRLALTITADVIGMLSSEEAAVSLQSEYLEVLNVVQSLCCSAEDRANFFWLRRFLLRQIIHRHGASRIYSAMAISSVACLLPKDIRAAVSAEALFDPFVIENKHKDTYHAIRNALSASIVENSMAAITTCFQAINETAGVKNVCLATTICSVIFRSYFNHEAKGVPKSETLDKLETFVMQLQDLKSKEMIIKMLRNSLPRQLELRPSSGSKDAVIALLICHLWILLLHQDNHPLSLSAHLSALVTDPRSMKGKYFPTMPHDRFLDVKDTMRGISSQQENLTPYECSNGHIYYIGNCGRPWLQDRCPQCGSTIGGANHNLAEGNRLVTFEKDSTQPGHILGPVDSPVQPPTAERQLSPIMCAITRTILHITLYASAAANGPSSVQELISPEPVDVCAFLWSHICNDLARLQLAIGKPFDDCIVLLHAIVAGLPDAIASHDNINWSTHAGRSQWEASLQMSKIKDYIQHHENYISSAYNSVRHDAQQSSNTAALMQLLSDNGLSSNIENVLTHPELWQCYKSPTLEHFAIQLENQQASANQGISLNSSGAPVSPREYSLMFMRSREAAAVIACLPDVISINNLLHMEYSRSLEASAAASLSIDQFLETQAHRSGHALKPLIESFIKAWNAVHHELKSHRFWFCGVMCQAPAEACSKKIGFDSPVTMLLAGRHGLALCSVALATYLGSMHNMLLAKTVEDCRQRPAVSMLKAQASQLISFDAQKDLLPIILANCEYTLKVGERNAELQYNFDAIEHMIVDRFVRHKPLLLLPGKLEKDNEMHLYLFRGEVTHGAQLGKLSNTITQVVMPHNTKTRIIKEYRGDQMEVSDSLVLIDQVIGFLLTSSVSHEAWLWRYMHDTLQMSVNSRISSVLKICRLCHVKALWVLLSLERIKALSSDPQVLARARSGRSGSDSSAEHFILMDWFSCVDKRYTSGIVDPAIIPHLVASLRKIRNEQAVACMLELFYEFIIVKLASADCRGADSLADDENDGAENYPLFLSLNTYVEETYNDDDKKVNQAVEQAIYYLKQLEADFEQLQVRHAVATWMLILSTSLEQAGSQFQGQPISTDPAS